MPGESTPIEKGASPRMCAELEHVAVPDMHEPELILIEDVTWSVAEGDFWVVCGTPGSGKSQLLLMAAGLLPAVQGSQWLFGRELHGLSEAQLLRFRKRIGFVFAEGGRLFNSLTVDENVALPLRYHDDSTSESVQEQAASLLVDFGLAGYATSIPARLTRPWKQRAALARALALGPEVLFLDDPLAGLDVGQSRWWLEFLSKYITRTAATVARNTIVVATDDPRPWLMVASRFGLISKNHWIPIGDRAAFESSTDPAIRELLAEPH